MSRAIHTAPLLNLLMIAIGIESSCFCRAGRNAPARFLRLAPNFKTYRDLGCERVQQQERHLSKPRRDLARERRGGHQLALLPTRSNIWNVRALPATTAHAHARSSDGPSEWCARLSIGCTSCEPHRDCSACWSRHVREEPSARLPKHHVRHDGRSCGRQAVDDIGDIDRSYGRKSP